MTVQLALDPALLNDEPLIASIDATADAGYRAVELSNRDDVIGAWKPVTIDADQVAAVRRRAHNRGVDIASVAIIQSWSSPDEEQRTRAVQWWIDGMRVAVDLGSTRVNSELAGSPHEPAACRAAFLRSIETIVPHLEREGLRLSIEPHPWDFIETTAGALDLFAEVGSDRVKYLHCTPHEFHLGNDARTQIAAARGKFDHIHLADTFRPDRTIVNPPGLDHRIHQHFDLGDGELDWDSISDALRDADFDGLATVQVFGWPERARESFARNRPQAERILGLAQEMESL